VHQASHYLPEQSEPSRSLLPKSHLGRVHTSASHVRTVTKIFLAHKLLGVGSATTAGLGSGVPACVPTSGRVWQHWDWGRLQFFAGMVVGGFGFGQANCWAQLAGIAIHRTPYVAKNYGHDSITWQATGGEIKPRRRGLGRRQARLT